jgi:hypothetical protein
MRDGKGVQRTNEGRTGEVGVGCQLKQNLMVSADCEPTSAPCRYAAFLPDFRPQLPPSWGRFFTKQLDRGSHSRVITEITEATQTRGGHHLFITQFFRNIQILIPPVG